MEKIFDTHAHYNNSAFDEDRLHLLDSLCESGISAVINCGTDIGSSKISLEYSGKYPYIYAACGIHPEDADKAYDGCFDDLRELLQNEKAVAVGEIGLDYHYRDDNKEKQKKLLKEQIALANELSLPVIIHDRDAHGDTLEILKELKPKGVVHCFSGSTETMKEILNLGMYIGLGGTVTFKNAKKPAEIAECVPLDRLLLETDCPYMAPVPVRGQRNNSLFIQYVAEKIAEIRGISADTVIRCARENAEKLFEINPLSN